MQQANCLRFCIGHKTIIPWGKVKKKIRFRCALQVHRISNQWWTWRVKTVGKIPENIGSVFHIFRSFLYYSVNTVIGMKMGYGVMGIGRNTVGLSYSPILDWTKNFGNFSDFLHCSSGLLHCSSRLGLLSFLF
jgi:hypothetical protein